MSSIKLCNSDMHRDLYGSIVLAGGTAALPGFAERLRQEVTSLAPMGMRVRVVEAPDCAIAPWIGGSIVADLSTFRDQISMQNMDHRSCIASGRFSACLAP